MAQQHDRKAELIADLERSRIGMGRNFRGMRGNLNVTSHLRAAFFRQKAVWITGALLGGWLLTRIPARRKQVSLSTHPVAAVAKPEKESKGFLWAALGLAATLLRPAITSFATQKLAEFVARRDSTAASSTSPFTSPFTRQPPTGPSAPGSRSRL